MRTPTRRPSNRSDHASGPNKRQPARPQGNASRPSGRNAQDAGRPRRERTVQDSTPRPSAQATRSSKVRGPLYFGHVVPGLERLAARELGDTLNDVTVIETLARFDDRTSLVIFGYSSDAKDLLDLALFEDVFALVTDRAGIGSDRAALKSVAGMVAGASLDEAFRLVNPIRPGNRRKPTYRVIARKTGDHAYRRTDLRSTIERAVQERHPDWGFTDPARLEVWAQLVSDRLVAGIRLSDETMRQRTYKLANLPASLKPTVARAMAMLTRPQDDDVMLDPMCGGGTILIERAHCGRYARLEGGDIEHAAVQATIENVGTHYKPISVREWDARSLPFADGEISAIASNLPFGKQIGTRDGNRSLYPALLAEWTRVLKPGGRMVLLTSESRLLRASAKEQPGLIWEQAIPVVVRGLPAEIFVFQRT